MTTPYQDALRDDLVESLWARIKELTLENEMLRAANAQWADQSFIPLSKEGTGWYFKEPRRD